MSVTEQEFLREIDCRFPYDDAHRWRRLIDRSVALSPNAAFAVLYEVCAPGQSRKSTLKQGQLQTILEYWLSRFDHPAVGVVLPAAISLLAGGKRTEAETITAMREIARYPGLHFALVVLDYACDDVNGRVNVMFNTIGEAWKDSQRLP